MAISGKKDNIDEQVGNVTGISLTTGEHEVPPFMLSPDDPFEQLLVTIIETARRKRSDYANNQNIYLNFDRASSETGLRPLDIVDVLVAIKNGRIANLRGRDPANETIADTYLDRAIYAILAYGVFVRDQYPQGAPIRGRVINTKSNGGDK